MIITYISMTILIGNRERFPIPIIGVYAKQGRANMVARKSNSVANESYYESSNRSWRTGISLRSSIVVIRDVAAVTKWKPSAKGPKEEASQTETGARSKELACNGGEEDLKRKKQQRRGGQVRSGRAVVAATVPAGPR